MAYVGQVNSLTIGGLSLINPTAAATGLITLWAYCSANGGYSTPRKNNASAGYQVTSGKTFTILQVNIFNQTTAGMDPHLGYGTTDSGFNGTVPTGDNWLGKGSGGGTGYVGSVAICYAAANANMQIALPGFTIPQNDYLSIGWSTNGTMAVQIIGTEA